MTRGAQFGSRGLTAGRLMKKDEAMRQEASGFTEVVWNDGGGEIQTRRVRTRLGESSDPEMVLFERLLKRSQYFSDCMNTHRRATAAVSAQLIVTLMNSGKIGLVGALAFLEEQSKADHPSPSEGSARRLQAALIRDELVSICQGDNRKGAKR